MSDYTFLYNSSVILIILLLFIESSSQFSLRTGFMQILILLHIFGDYCELKAKETHRDYFATCFCETSVSNGFHFFRTQDDSVGNAPGPFSRTKHITDIVFFFNFLKADVIIIEINILLWGFYSEF